MNYTERIVLATVGYRLQLAARTASSYILHVVVRNIIFCAESEQWLFNAWANEAVHPNLFHFELSMHFRE
jgi:hypothetical protein